MMTTREKLLALQATYRLATSLPENTMSYRLFGRNTKLGEIIAGGDLTTGTYDRALKWFSDNWPENVPWPENVERPTPSIVEVQP